MSYLRAFLLAALLFPVATATHEVLHIVIWSMLGVRAALEVTHWTLQFVPVTILGLHAAPIGPGGLGAPDAVTPLADQVANNLLGPLAAAVIFMVLWASVGRRSQVARAALLANVAVLLFFALLELAFPLLYQRSYVAADILLIPELNYGGALLLMLVVIAASLGRRRPTPRLRAVEGGAPSSTASAS